MKVNYLLCNLYINALVNGHLTPFSMFIQFDVLTNVNILYIYNIIMFIGFRYLFDLFGWIY